jgi:hypothetical protein
MQCAECGRDIGPGTRQFGLRVPVLTKAGITIMLCGSCGEPGKPILRRWAAIETEESLAALSTTVYTGFR